MRAIFGLLLLLLAVPAHAQPAPHYGPAPCPFNGTSCQATATSGTGTGTIARTLGDHFGGCEPNALRCRVLDGRDWGMGVVTSAAQNRTDLLNMLAAVAAGPGSGFELHLPTCSIDASAGSWTVSSNAVSILGSGFGTVLTISGNGTAWNLTGNFITLSGIEMYHASANTSGPDVVVAGGQIQLNNMTFDNSFGAIEIKSGFAVWENNIQIQGANSNTGAFGQWIHRSSSSGVLPSAIMAVNYNSVAAVPTELLMQACDGCQFSNGEIAFGTAVDYLHQPQYASDQITGTMMANMLIGTTGGTPTHAVDYEPVSGGGQTGYEGYDSFVGGRIDPASADGMLFNDPSVAGVTISGMNILGAGTNGISIQGGKGFTVTGNVFQGNDTSTTAGDSDLLIGSGTNAPTYVNATGNSFIDRLGVTAPVRVTVAGAADHIIVGPMTHAPTGVTNFVNTSSGTDILGPTPPTSCGGLPSGTLWNNAGAAAFCP